MRASQIAAALGYELAGDSHLEIVSITYAAEASQNALAIATSEADLRRTRASAVLMRPHLIPTKKTIIYCTDDLEYAAVRVARLLIEDGELPNYDRPAHFESSEFGAWLGSNCHRGDGSILEPTCAIGDDVTIGPGARIEAQAWIGSGVVLGRNVRIRSGARVGTPALYYCGGHPPRFFAGIGTVYIEDDADIGNNAVVQRGAFATTIIGAGTCIGPCAVIGHDTRIGKGCRIVAQVGIAGNARLGDEVTVYGQAGVTNNVEIGDRAVVMAQSRVGKNIESDAIVSGTHGRKHTDELRLQARLIRNLEDM